MRLEEELDRGVQQLGLALNAESQNKLLNYLALLNKWNKVYNLTAIREQTQMVTFHLLDSLAVIPYLWPGKWLDVGSGAGLPGVVLAIARPDWQFTLLDSNSKKTSFMQQAVIELDISNVSVYCARVEVWKTTQRFDGIISRAFSELGDFLRCTRHLIAKSGRWAAMKGTPAHELEMTLPSGCSIERVIPVQVPNFQGARSLVIATCKGSEGA